MRLARLAAILAFSAAASAFAAHPLQTEDTGTQGAGDIEIENAFSWTRQAGTRQFQYQPQFSLGLTPSVDLIVQPSWVRSHDPGSGTTSGWGDTNFDAKWRFYAQESWSFGVRAGLAFATSQHALGMPRGDVSPHAVLVATYVSAPLMVHANVGLTRNPANTGLRKNVGSASAAVMWSVNERLILTGETTLSAEADPSRSAWRPAALVGAIYTLRPGLDLDCGYQSSWRTPTQRQWLAGLTYRFAP